MKKNIVLICAGGMSTSLLVNKMRDVAAAEGHEWEINAYGVAQASTVIPDADIVLLGPQVRFNQKKYQSAYPDKIIECMAMQDYGSMNGAAIVKFAKERLPE